MSAKYNKEFSVLTESIAREQEFPAVQVQVALTPELIPAVIHKRARSTFPPAVLTEELIIAVAAHAKRSLLKSDDTQRDLISGLITGIKLPDLNKQAASNKHEEDLAFLQHFCTQRDVSTITHVTLNNLLHPFSINLKKLLATDSDLFNLKLAILFARRDATRELLARDAGDGSHTKSVQRALRPSNQSCGLPSIWMSSPNRLRRSRMGCTEILLPFLGCQ